MGDGMQTSAGWPDQSNALAHQCVDVDRIDLERALQRRDRILEVA
jgi:hypothetical protein